MNIDSVTTNTPIIASKDIVKRLTVIHYGNTMYRSVAFSKIKNFIGHRNKPWGGLWTSPVNSKHGWRDWCRNNDFRDCDKSNSFKLKFHDTAKILLIDSAADTVNIPTIELTLESYTERCIDFEKLASNYDAIWLTECGEQETKYHIDYDNIVNFYGWDCESILILNPDCCYQIK